MASEAADNADRRLEVLRQIPPLLPQFLRKRRVGLPALRPLMQELGLEPPVFFTLVQLHEIQGSFDWQPVTRSQIRARDPYSTLDTVSEPLAALEAKALITCSPDGYISLKPRAREAMDHLHEAARDYVGHLRPLPARELDELARQLERADKAVLHDPVLSPRPGSHLAGSRSPATFGEDAPAMVRIEQAIFDLWMARDDAHIRAWTTARLDGPSVAVLTLLWSDEARTVRELRVALKHEQSPATVDASLANLAEHEYAVRDSDDVIELTPSGALLRADIERETDRIYFAPWPQTRAEAARMRDLLQELVDNIKPPPPA